MSFVDPKPLVCFHCDFGSGQRGMDSCRKCDGTGSIFLVGRRAFSNTREGYLEAVYAANHCEEDIAFDSVC